MESKKRNTKSDYMIAIGMGIVFFVVIGLVFGSGGSNQPTIQKNTSNETVVDKNHPTLGEEGILNNNEDMTNCEGATLVASTEANYELMNKRTTAKDDFGLAEMLDKGQIALVPNCTPVKVIGDGGILSFVTEVRFLEDPTVTAWAAFEFVRKQ